MKPLVLQAAGMVTFAVTVAVVFEAEVRTAPGSSFLITSLVCIEQKWLFSSRH